jgi:carbonic anhydrase
MHNVEILLERNARLAAGEPPDPAGERLPGGLLLTCVDPRVDPAHVLGLGANESAVLRNPGGRVTPALLESLEVLAHVGFARPGVTPELIVMHHTDCGLSHMGLEYRGLLASYFAVAEGELDARQVGDPLESVRFDVRLLASSRLPRRYLVSGVAYDVAQKKATLVVPPTEVGG